MSEPVLVARGAREPMPGRRRSITVKATIQGTNVYYTFSRFPDGRIAEVFVDVQRAGTALRGAMSALAISISVGLQYGTPLQVYVDALRGVDFEPRGSVDGEVSEDVKFCTSIIDYLVLALEVESKRGSEVPKVEEKP